MNASSSQVGTSTQTRPSGLFSRSGRSSVGWLLTSERPAPSSDFCCRPHEPDVHPDLHSLIDRHDQLARPGTAATSVRQRAPDPRDRRHFPGVRRAAPGSGPPGTYQSVTRHLRSQRDIHHSTGHQYLMGERMSQAAIVVEAPAVDLRPTRPACVRPLPPLHVTPVLRVDTAQIAADYRTLAAALPRVALHYAIKANPAAAGPADPARPRVPGGTSRARVRSTRSSPSAAIPADLSYGNTIKRAADIAYAIRLRSSGSSPWTARAS